MTTRKKINLLMTGKDKKSLLLLIILSIFVSIIETISVSLIMPFLLMVQHPELMVENQYIRTMCDFLNIVNHSKLITIFGMCLVIFYIFRAMTNIGHYYLLHRFSFKKQYDISLQLFKHYLSFPYKKFTTINTSSMVKTIITDTEYMIRLLLQSLFFMSELCTTILIYLILLYVNWKTTLILSIIMGSQVLFLLFFVSRTIKKQGKKRTHAVKHLMLTLNNTFSNFKMFKLISNHESAISEFCVDSYQLKQASTITNGLIIVPRNILEAVGFSTLIIAIIYMTFLSQDIVTFIPILTIYALSLYRILPALNRMMHSYNQILFFYPSLKEICDDLNEATENLGEKQIFFNQQIQLCGVSFEYQNSAKIIENTNIIIKKNTKVAFVGESGSGKTTLIDIIIGLQTPTLGQVKVDNTVINNENIKSWRQKVGYIPQDLYLLDTTLGENIALGHEYNEKRIINVLKQAKIYDFFSSGNGLETQVGEGGIKLSGGQKQRVGIARALYNNPEILILDEATSALDEETETKIMKEIEEISKEKTLLIIAHRLSTISQCDVVYKVEKMNVVKL